MIMSKDTILYCNPSQDSRGLELWFGASDGFNIRSAAHADVQSEQMLGYIRDILEGDIPAHIIVVNKAESFTAIRILITICNTMAYTWNCALHTIAEPIVDMKEVGESLQETAQYITPHYSKAPNIS